MYQYEQIRWKEKSALSHERERVVVVVGKEAESNLLGRAYPLHRCRGVDNNNSKELHKEKKANGSMLLRKKNAKNAFHVVLHY